MTGEYAKVRVRYEIGGQAAQTVVGLATRTKYGRKRRGDVFWVHREDIEAAPNWFTPLGDAPGASVVEALPKTPDALRIAAVPDLPKERAIEELGIGTRATNALHERGYHMLSELRGLSDEELLGINGIGPWTLAQIRAAQRV